MRVLKNKDSGDKRTPDFPPVVPASDITLECAYVLSIHFGNGDGTLVGPFKAITLPTRITEHYPMIGHYALLAELRDESIERVFIPRDGIVRMCGVQYALHTATEATIGYFRESFKHGRDILLAERARQAEDCKYLD